MADDYNSKSMGIGYLTGPSDFGELSPIITKWTENPKVTACEGDILITVKGSGVGKMNLLDKGEIAISRQLMAIRVDDKKADTRFIYAFLSLQSKYFQSLGNGAAIPGLSRENVLSLVCPLPTISEQKNMVTKIELFLKQTKKLEKIYHQRLSDLEKLKKSVLQKAFSGEL